MTRAVTIAFLFAAMTSGAYAQASVATQAREAFEAHDYARALRFLEQLHDQSPSPQILFNEATCLSRLARHREAVAVLTELLAWPDLAQVFDATQRAAVREALAASQDRLGSLTLSGPPGTMARVDGELDCEVPCVMSLDEGDHGVEYDGHIAQVTLVPGEHASLDLTPTEAAMLTPTPVQPVTRRFQPGVLTWVGAGMAVAGAAGVIGFGLRSNALMDQWDDADPLAPKSLADEGRLMTGLANASIAVLGVGLVIMLIDLLIEREVE